jgi:transmembrane 9 superfamily protein 2/4
VYLILGLTCTLVSIIFCYFQLCAENYYWWGSFSFWKYGFFSFWKKCVNSCEYPVTMTRWWRSIFISGSTGIYVFFYGVAYYWTKLHIENGPSAVLYFGWVSFSWGFMNDDVFTNMSRVDIHLLWVYLFSF